MILMALGLINGNNNGIGLLQTKMSIVKSQIDLILLRNCNNHWEVTVMSNANKIV